MKIRDDGSCIKYIRMPDGKRKVIRGKDLDEFMKNATNFYVENRGIPEFKRMANKLELLCDEYGVNFETDANKKTSDILTR